MEILVCLCATQVDRLCNILLFDIHGDSHPHPPSPLIPSPVTDDDSDAEDQKEKLNSCNLVWEASSLLPWLLDKV